MPKIVLSPDAPEGQTLGAAFGTLEFDAGNKKSYETDDPALLDEARRHPFFAVEGDQEGVSKAEINEYKKQEARVAEAREERATLIATLEPWDAVPIDPRTPEDLEVYEKQVAEINGSSSSSSSSTTTEQKSSGDSAGGSN